jgi:hypothetical protein
MTYMRQYPPGIRSVTLDSVEPPEVIAANLFAANARAGFGNLFRACTEQPQCWRRSPGIAQTFTDLVRRLEAHPVTTWVEPPAGGSPVKVVLDRGRLVNWLINESENTPDYRNVPAMIAELADGDPRPIATEAAARALSSGIGASRLRAGPRRGLRGVDPVHEGLDPVGRPTRVPGLSGLGARAGPARDVPSPGMPRVERSDGAR